MHGLNWFQVILIILSVSVTVTLAIQTTRAFKSLSIGQKLWATGSVLLLMYATSSVAHNIRTGLPWWRTLILSLGLIAYYAYLLEPRHRKKARFGGNVLDPHPYD